MTHVSAAIPSPTTAAWQLGPLTLRAYALCIILGIVVACWVTERRLRRRGAPQYLVLDVAIWAVPAGIIGARIYSLITSPQEYFGKNDSWLEPIKIWHGGLGIWGAVAGGALGSWIACRQKGVPLTMILDAAAPALPLAQAIGRFGNWFNNELYGRATTLPWGLKVYQMDQEHPGRALVMDGKPVVLGTFQPTFLYEALWNVGVAVLVVLMDRKYRFGRGRAFALYVMAYTAGRFWIEYLRVDVANRFLGLRINDWVSIVVFLAALVYFRRVHGPAQFLEVDADGRMRVVDDPTGEGAPEDAADPAAKDAEDPAAKDAEDPDAEDPEAEDPATEDPATEDPDAEAAGEAADEDSDETAGGPAPDETVAEATDRAGEAGPGEEATGSRSPSAVDR